VYSIVVARQTNPIVKGTLGATTTTTNITIGASSNSYYANNGTYLNLTASPSGSYMLSTS